jgi:hypothetical protein
LNYVDTLTKRFLTAGTRLGLNDKFQNYQDPTYLGFTIKIVNSLNSQSLDEIPHGLFCISGENNEYSAIKYLESRGEKLRANYLREFESYFRKIVTKAPWYFTKISGLADLWKIDPKQNWRAKDKKIVIDTLESIDLRINYMIDLYRKACFDQKWMRWALPDIMRQFKMEIIVSEVRLLKIQEGGNIPEFNPGYIIDDTFSSDTLDYPGAKSLPWSAGTFMKFTLEQCEIDITESNPTLESLGTIAESPVSNKITIKFGNIVERNVYGLLGGIIEETLNWRDYTKGNFFLPSEIASSNSEPNIFLDRNVVEEGFYGTDYLLGEKERKLRYMEFFPENVFAGQNFDKGNGLIENTLSDYAEPQTLSVLTGNINLSSFDKLSIATLENEIKELVKSGGIKDLNSLKTLFTNTAKSFENQLKDLPKNVQQNFETYLNESLGTNNITLKEPASIVNALQKFSLEKIENIGLKDVQSFSFGSTKSSVENLVKNQKPKLENALTKDLKFFAGIVGDKKGNLKKPSKK